MDLLIKKRKYMDKVIRQDCINQVPSATYLSATLQQIALAFIMSGLKHIRVALQPVLFNLKRGLFRHCYALCP